MEGKIPALKISQNERDMLLFSVPAKLLKEISYFNPREFDREKGIQRPYQLWRSKEIAKYIDSEDSVLPNDIIINLELERLGLTMEEVYDGTTHTLDLKKMIKKANDLQDTNKQLKGKIAFVIDGQHRLRAFEYTEKDIPLVIAALVNLSLAEVAEIFVKINYYQKPVNKSLVLDLLGISQDVFPQYYKLHEVVKRLNEDIESPFYSNIKMLGIGKGFISQASIISAIEKYKIEKVLEDLQVEPTKDILYNVIWNFFTAVEEVFDTHWGEKRFLSKTIGIRSLFLLMQDMLVIIASEGRKFCVEEVRDRLGKIDKKLFESPEVIGLGGEKGVKLLYQKLKEQLEEKGAK